MAKYRARKTLIGLLGVLAFLVAFFVAFDLCLRPVAMTMCRFRAQGIAAAAVNDATYNLMQTERLEDIITLQRDEYGRITAATTDATRINRYAAAISNEVQDSINKSEPSIVNVPVADIFGGTAVAGRGPVIPVRFTPSCVVTTDVSSVFESVGINQTRHSVIIDVQVDLRVTLPLHTTYTEYRVQVPASETIIVGTVPETLLTNSGDEGVRYNLVPDSD